MATTITHIIKPLENVRLGCTLEDVLLNTFDLGVQESLKNEKFINESKFKLVKILNQIEPHPLVVKWIREPSTNIKSILDVFGELPVYDDVYEIHHQCHTSILLQAALHPDPEILAQFCQAIKNNFPDKPQPSLAGLKNFLLREIASREQLKIFHYSRISLMEAAIQLSDATVEISGVSESRKLWSRMSAIVSESLSSPPSVLTDFYGKTAIQSLDISTFRNGLKRQILSRQFPIISETSPILLHFYENTLFREPLKYTLKYELPEKTILFDNDLESRMGSNQLEELQNLVETCNLVFSEQEILRNFELPYFYDFENHEPVHQINPMDGFSVCIKNHFALLFLYKLQKTLKREHPENDALVINAGKQFIEHSTVKKSFLEWLNFSGQSEAEKEFCDKALSISPIFLQAIFAENSFDILKWQQKDTGNTWLHIMAKHHALNFFGYWAHQFLEENRSLLFINNNQQITSIDLWKEGAKSTAKEFNSVLSSIFGNVMLNDQQISLREQEKLIGELVSLELQSLFSASEGKPRDRERQPKTLNRI